MIFSAIAAIESEGDRSFMEKLYRKYYPLMYKKAIAMLHSPQEAEDAVEAAFLKLIERVDSLRACNAASLRSYLLSCAKNASIDRLRRANRASAYVFDEAEGRPDAQVSSEGADARLLRAETIRAVADALERLRPRERELLRMKYYEELSDAEIAGLLNLTPSTIRSNLTRARRRLGALLKEANE